MSGTEGEVRLPHDGRWWELGENGSILVYDDETKRWDVWDEKLDGPLPPPDFLVPSDRERLAGKSSSSPGLLRLLAWLFGITVAAWAVLSIYMVAVQTDESRFLPQPPDLLYTLATAAFYVWVASAAAIFVLTALSANRYMRRRLLEGRPDVASPELDEL